LCKFLFLDQVRRSILNSRGAEVGYRKGKIVGWLPAGESGFMNNRTKRAAALWHVRYEEVCEKHRRYSPLAMGEEDFEEDEVKDAVASFRKEQDPPAWYICAFAMHSVCARIWHPMLAIFTCRSQNKLGSLSPSKAL